jgi:hypothetical protein
MCQQWFSVAGLLVSAAGFLFLIWQWFRAFEDYSRDEYAKISAFMREQRIKHGAEMSIDYDDDNDDDYNHSMGKHLGMGLQERLEQHKKLIIFGVVGTMFGSALQIVGSWPRMNLLGIVACS